MSIRIRSALARQNGMTLIELMVSMVIGIFLTWGAFEVYLQTKGNYRTAEIATRLQENARYALETLEPDLRLAGFWGLHSEPALIAPSTGISVRCDGADISAWALDLASAVAASDEAYDLPCAPFSEARSNSDVLIVRHASELLREPQEGQVQLQSSLALARLFNDGEVPEGFAATSETRDLQVHAYYIDNRSSFLEDSPSLRRLTLVNGGVIEDQEMISGAENLQVQFGLDTNRDGVVERYVDPDDPAAGNETIAAVRVWLLVRSDEAPSAGFRDSRQYPTPDRDAPAITPGDAFYPASFQRLEVTKTVQLRNRVRG